jgi:hypothetical protein
MTEWPGVVLALLFMLSGMAAVIYLLRPIFLRDYSRPGDDVRGRLEDVSRKVDLMLALLRDIQTELARSARQPPSGTTAETGIKQ